MKMKGVAAAAAVAIVLALAAAAGVGAQQCVRTGSGWSCGSDNNQCCSSSGWCGPSADYCGDGCMGGACYASRMCGRQAAGASCWNNRCCSQHGWCGGEAAYCGSGCQSGPCWRRVANATTAVAAVVTKDAFDHMLPSRGCPARAFYTYEAFVAAAGAFPAFAAAGSADARKKEVAAFLTHTTAASRGYCHKEEEVKLSASADDYCVATAEWPCVPGKKYHARGPVQITYNYKYGPAGRAIGANLLERPDLVTSDAVVAFQTALWLWMTPQATGKPSPHDAFTASLATGSP